MSCSRICALLLLTVGVSLPAHAGYVYLDDVDLGADSIVQDGATGTQWLRMDLSSLSPTDVSLIGGATGPWARFRYATAAELSGLFWANSVLPSSVCTFVTSCAGNINSFFNADILAAREFQSFFGLNSYGGAGSPNLYKETSGRYDGGTFFLADGGNVLNYGSSNGCFTFGDCVSPTPDYSGNWLVRTASGEPDPPSVSEPPALTLFALAILAGLLRRKYIPGRLRPLN